MIDYSLIKIIPAEESHREFSYKVKKEAYGAYITATYGWEEQKQRNFHDMDWQQRRVSIIVYREEPIGTIYINRNNNYLEIGEFFLLTQHQNQGIGSYLLKNLLADADKIGQLSKLAVLKVNPAIALYRRYGFEIVSEDKVAYFMERKPKVTAKNDRKYQAVIFDLFGTLVDIFDRAGYYSVLREMISILKAPPDDFTRLFKSTAEQRATGAFRTLEENLVYICRELKVPVKNSQIALAKWTRFDYVALALAPKPDVLETLAQLKSSGYKIGLISNCSTEPPVIWPKTPFAPFFDTTIFSSTSGLQKPDPRIYMLTTEKLSVKPEVCLYIGDGDGNELTGAALVGMHPVLIRNPRENSINALRTDDYQGNNWDGLVITSLKEVLNLLEE